MLFVVFVGSDLVREEESGGLFRSCVSLVNVFLKLDLCCRLKKIVKFFEDDLFIVNLEKCWLFLL